MVVNDWGRVNYSKDTISEFLKNRVHTQRQWRRQVGGGTTGGSPRPICVLPTLYVLTLDAQPAQRLDYRASNSYMRDIL